MALYTVESRTLAGEFVTYLPYSNLQFEYGINGPTGYRFSVPLFDDHVTRDSLKPGYHECWIKRNDEVVKAGPLWDIVSSSEGSTLNCSGMSLEDYFDVRLTLKSTFKNVDQADIAWGLILASQARANGDLGITAGTLQHGRTRTIEWAAQDNKYILEAIQDISSLEDGFDWLIEPASRTFNVYYPRLQREGPTFSFPENIKRYAIQYMGKYHRNYISVVGPKDKRVVAESPSKRSYYGLREYADSFQDARNTNELTEYAGYVRDKRSEIKRYPTVVLHTDVINVFDNSQIALGDKCHIVIRNGYDRFDEQLRHVGGQVTVTKNGAEQNVLYFEDLRELEE